MTDCTLTILFEGLMVFHAKDSGNYEVGICSYAPDHLFATINDKKIVPLNVCNPDRRWRIELQDQDGHTVQRSVTLSGPLELRDRCQDDPGQADYFNWIMDFESEEFHDGELEMESGMLNPIIELTTGQLYTYCKVPELERKQGVANDTFSHFGFIAETIGLKIELCQDEKVVLIMGGDQGEMTLATCQSGKDTIRPFYNMPLHHYEHLLRADRGSHESDTHSGHLMIDDEVLAKVPSHLQNYYLLFSCIDAAERFETKFKDHGVNPSNLCNKSTDTYPFRCSPVLISARLEDLD